MRVTMKIEGLRGVDAAFGELKKATANAVAKRVLKRAGQPIAQRAAELAPDDPETGAPDLHTSIIVSPKIKNEVGKSAFADVMQAGGSRSEAVAALRDARRAANGEGSVAVMHVGVDSRIGYAHLLEFGTVNHGPRPFMRPAFEEKKGEALEIIVRDLSGEIDKAKARAAARALKLGTR
jgi:HK97 gp10 family phage protein